MSTALKRGRPTALDDRRVDDIIAYLKRGAGFYRAVQRTGLSKTTAENWRRKGRVVQARLERGLDAGMLTEHEAALLRITVEADRQEAETLSRAEGIMRQRLDEGDERTAQWVLERKLPSEYGRGPRVEEVADLDGHDWREVVARLREMADAIEAEHADEIVVASVER